MSITYDEPGHLRYGRQLLHGDARRFDDSKMPVSVLNALPGAVAAALPAGRPADARWRASTPRGCRRCSPAVALAWLVWRWSRRLWGERGALLSLLLCVFDPNLLAHARLVTTDVWIALAFTVVLYLFWRFAEEPTRRRGLVLATRLRPGAGRQVQRRPAVAAARCCSPRCAGGRSSSPRGAAASAARRAGSVLRAAAAAALALLLTLVVIDLAFLGDRILTPFGDYRFRSSTLQRGAARAACARRRCRCRSPIPTSKASTGCTTASAPARATAASTCAASCASAAASPATTSGRGSTRCRCRRWRCCSRR